ncbi:MAG: CDP-alcohol phosphatidyltransferase family protein [Clostridia bacterium]|nr:CDP-alcohol phosphatidyltransferase family protein [Clostridia bacterium]
MKNNKIFTIPNILSFFRIVLIPFIIWTFFIKEYWLCAGLIVFSGLTDLADGYIARRFNMISPLGKVLDPIADKLTLFAIILSLCMISDVVFIVLVMFVVKEISMGIEGIIVLKKIGTTYSAKWYGKITTLFLYLTMITHVLWKNIPSVLSLIMLIVCDLLMTLTFVMYTIKNIKLIKTANLNKNN